MLVYQSRNSVNRLERPVKIFQAMSIEVQANAEPRSQDCVHQATIRWHEEDDEKDAEGIKKGEVQKKEKGKEVKKQSKMQGKSYELESKMEEENTSSSKFKH